MNQREARAKGLHNGYAIAEQNAHDSAQKWLRGESDADGLIESIISDACETEQEHFRQFSPFEHFAYAINESGDRAEGLWEAYDAGVCAGAAKAAVKFAKTEDAREVVHAYACIEAILENVFDDDGNREDFALGYAHACGITNCVDFANTVLDAIVARRKAEKEESSGEANHRSPFGPGVG